MYHETLQQPAWHLSLPVGNGTQFFAITDIVRLEASSNYTYIHFINRRPLLMAKVLCDFETLLEPYGFVRTHRRHLVNKEFVTAIHPSGDIVLQDESKVQLSRRRRKEVLAFFKV